MSPYLCPDCFQDLGDCVCGQTPIQAEEPAAKTIEDGGAAFPRAMSEIRSMRWSAQAGMTLRDYFAGQVIMVTCTHPYFMGKSNLSMAEAAYELADAMLEARKR
jgi:hypothetical protein